MPTESSVAYLDASALYKLVVAEHESAALRRAARSWPRRATSRVAVVELVRSVRRADPLLEPLARRTLAAVHLLALTDRVFATAALLEPPGVRTLDAIHVASALRIRTALTAFVSYDAGQLEAAEAAGLPVMSPS